MRKTVLFTAAAALVTLSAAAQSITLPPSGGNQRQTIVQEIGPVQVTVEYSSPHVHSPQGVDRRGKIWGGLVPYGLTNLGFGTCKECPWRAGANQNTTFATSDDILVEGQKLAAGTYGVHMIPDPNEWTVIFSKNHTSWGSFTYDPAEDALRVKVKPQKNDYKEVLTYDFTERKNDTATLALEWEELAVPIHITVPNANDLYIARIAEELRSSPGFTWQNWQAAAQFALTVHHPVEALTWAKASTSAAVGQENFTTLITLAKAYEANGQTAEAAATEQKALAHPSATPLDLHQYGRLLLTMKKPQEALKIFELNHKRFGETWPVNVGLARGYSAVGRYDDALKYAKLALAQAPDEGNKQNLAAAIKKLEAKQDIN